MKNDAFELPESLYEFAQITDFPKVIESLSDLAEKEDWTYQYSPDTDKTGYPILANMHIGLTQPNTKSCAEVRNIGH